MTDSIPDQITSDVLGNIRTLLAGYSGGPTIIRELAQNTDDVPGDDDRWLELHFHPDQLVIRNSTVFRPIDFQNITRIARGGKQQEQSLTIGTFGVGFTSVYQLTDTPIIRSADLELCMRPGLDASPIDRCTQDRIDFTQFTLPYRRQLTPVGQRLGMPVVTDAWIEEILRVLPDETYRLLFFLRRLSRIAVFHDNRLISAVSRVIRPDPAGFEQITLTTRRGTNAAQTHTWLRFTAQVPGTAPLRTDGQPDKDQAVHIVVPDRDVPDAFLRDHLTGRIYNYLPTEIDTGLPFQINGHFYPSTERKAIDNDHSDHKEWNQRVLTAIGSCLAGALPKLLHHFAATPLTLYQRIDVGNATTLVAPVRIALINAARSLKIFKTSDGWRDRLDTRWINAALRPIAQEMSPALMTLEHQQAAWSLIQQLDVREFTFDDVLKTIRDTVKPGTLLTSAPPYLHTRAQIEALYTALDSGLAHGNEQMLKLTPIFLDHTERLWPADRCVRSPKEELRKDLAESGLAFWNFNPERYRLAASLVAPFTLSRLWDILRQQLPSEVALANAPEWLNTPTKLYRLYTTIIGTGEEVLKSAVVGIHLCLNRHSQLCRPDRHLRMPDRDPILYEILADDPDTPLVAKPIYDNNKFRNLYSYMGVKPFEIDDLFDRLEKLARDEVRLADAHPCLNSREKLLRLYRYLRDNRNDLESKQSEALRHRLPIWLCRDGMLRRAKDRALPPEVTNLPNFIRVDHVLDLDGSEHLRSFLAEVVQLRPLGIEQFITQAFIPQFPELQRKEQIEGLRFLRSVITTIRDSTDLRERLKKTPLIYGTDDQLHRPVDLCFPRSESLTLFPDRFSEPSGFYAPPTNGDLTNWLWYDLFFILGVNHHRAPHDVIGDEIKRIVARPPRQGREQIEKIFRYLEKHWEFYQSTPLTRTLRDIPWLPADGDDVNWYRPKEIYQRYEKPLVSHVARVLGFSDARRPRTEIATALGFPSSVPISLMVKQLLVLSERGEPARTYLYETLSRSTVSDEDLKPLRGKAVIYANDRYWKPEQIFLSNQNTQFGSYRGYLTGEDFHSLFQRLGARSEPSAQDYVALVHEISGVYRENLPGLEAKLVTNAYERLAGADAALLTSLRSIPCVLSSRQHGEDETYALHLPESTILTPPEEYRRLLPDLPVAVYTTAGEPTLRTLGVRTINDEGVLQVEHRLQPSLKEPVELARYFGPLRRAIRRLFFHHRRNLERDLPPIEQRLGELRGYWQEGIQVVYHVHLGREIYASQPTRSDIFYEDKKNHVYLDRRLNEATLPRELARVLSEILDLREAYHSMFKELIAHPSQAMQILDDNNIKPLPQDLDLGSIPEQSIEELVIGAPSDSEDAGTPGEADLSQCFTEIAEDVPVKAGGTVVPAAKPPTSPSVSGGTPGKVHTPLHSGNGKRTPSYSPGAGSITPSGNGAGISNAQNPRTPPTKPQPEPDAPIFRGTTISSSPIIPTDYDGLRDRVRRWAEANGHSLVDTETSGSMPQKPPRKPRTEPTEQRNIARFILSFPEVRDGFLRLTTAHAQSLFTGSPTRVTCRTDEGESFPLWIDWRRDVPIAYNQEALGSFFDAESIPAGGIVYLQREHDETFRLYYNQIPHTIPEVRIAFNEQGEVRYETHNVEVRCETDDAIYRAERRFEDQTALWLEANGKKSVEETICDLLINTPDGWRHEDDLRAMVAAVRMVSASTVAQTLRAKEYFEPDNQGNWRLNPARLLAHVRDDAITRWQQATTKLLQSDDHVLGEALSILRPPLNDLTGRLLQIESMRASSVRHSDDALILIQQLNNDPDNFPLGASVVRMIQQRVDTADVDLALDPQLRAILRAVIPEVWSGMLRGKLHDMCSQLRQQHDYQRALALVRSWSTFDPDHGLNLAELETEAKAAQLLAGNPPALDAVLQSIALAPRLPLAREKLHVASQAALCQYEPHMFLTQGNDERAVDTFFTHIELVSAARPKLERANVPAFDRTVMVEMRKLWPHLNEHAQIRLLLWLPRYIDPASMPLIATELELLVGMAEHHHTNRNGLLIGCAAWKLCTKGHVLQPRLADHLARSHCALKIWEQANNRPWKNHVSPALRHELERGWRNNHATHVARERRLLELLREPDLSPLGITLEEVRKEKYQDYEKQYQRLLESAA